MAVPLSHDLIGEIYMGNVFLQGLIAGIILCVTLYLAYKAIRSIILPIRYMDVNDPSPTTAIEATRRLLKLYEFQLGESLKKKKSPPEAENVVAVLGDDGELIFGDIEAEEE